MTLPKTLIVVALAGSLSACRSMPPKKQAAAKITDVAQWLGGARDAERALCSPTADKTKPVTHCEGAAATKAGLTDARQTEAEKAFALASDALGKSTAAIATWEKGTPPPPVLHDLTVGLEGALLVVQSLNNDSSIAVIAESLQRAKVAVASIQGALTAG